MKAKHIYDINDTLVFVTDYIKDKMVSKPDNFIKLEDDVVETDDEFAMVRFTTYPPRYTLLKISNGEYEIDEKMTKTRHASWFEHKVNGKTVKRELVICFKPMELKDECR